MSEANYTVHVLHWTDFDNGDTSEGIDIDVTAPDEAAAIAAVRAEYPEHSWDAFVLGPR